MKKLLRLPFAVTALLTFTALAQAQIISIQFNRNGDPALTPTQTAGVDATDNWNVNTSNTTGQALSDNSGAATSATLTVNAGGYFTYNDFPGTSGDYALLSSGLNSSGGDTLSVASIPYATYDVYVYGVSDNSTNDNPPGTAGSLTTTYALTAGGTTEYFSLQPVTDSTSYIQSTNTYDGSGAPPTTGFTAGANYVEFTNLTASNLSLVFSGVDSSGTPYSFNASLNGIQIVDAAAPEPSTWAMILGGLGVLAFCYRRRLMA